jgi:CheY-like chemotaxis protein/anti-sigma regulatory factor (Ser/Thr protein kinase)
VRCDPEVGQVRHEDEPRERGVADERGPSLTPDQREQLALVKGSADALLEIVNDILDFSKGEAGQLALDPVDFGLRRCIDDALGVLAANSRRGDLQLVQRIAPDVPDAVHGDARRLRQVITNLVGNAIKFTERGEVVVEVTLRAPPTPHEAWLEVSVSDTGIGISPEKQGAIFEPFVQADSSISRRFGGTGLGLPISARLVQLLGGRLTVTSQVGVGSRFRFDLRLGVRELVDGPRPPAGQGAAARSTAAAPAQDRALKLLVVDDNAVNRLVAVRYLEHAGHRCVAVSDGRAAVTAVERERWDAILMDVQMPGVDGPQATAEIRTLEALTGRRTPILAVTAHALDEDRERCLAAGMDDFVSKPLSMTSLRAALGRVIVPAGGGGP